MEENQNLDNTQQKPMEPKQTNGRVKVEFAETQRQFKRRVERKAHANLLIGLLTLFLVIIFVCVVGWLVVRPNGEVIQGEVEANEVRVSGKLAGRIQQFYVEEGMTVKAGDTLVQISSPELYAKLQQAQAAKAAAQAQNAKAVKGARQEQIDAAYQMWQKSRAALEVMEKSYERMKKLYASEVVSAQKFDEVEAQYKAALATEKAAKTQYDMAKNGAQQEDKEAAEALVDRAQGAVQEVEAYLPETKLLAPIGGEISEIFPKQGELVGQGAPILNIVDLSSCWVTINVREDKLPDFKMGEVVHGVVPALGNMAIDLKITYIKALGTYATWRATKTSGDFDAKTFEVRAKPVKNVDYLRPGMTVLIEQ